VELRQVRFNVLHDTLYVILETMFPTNLMTDAKHTK